MSFERFANLKREVYIAWLKNTVNLRDISKTLKLLNDKLFLQENDLGEGHVWIVRANLNRQNDSLKQITIDMLNELTSKFMDCEKQLQKSASDSDNFNVKLNLLRSNMEQSFKLWSEGNYYEYGERLVAINDSLSVIAHRMEQIKPIQCVTSTCTKGDNQPVLDNCFTVGMNNETGASLDSSCLQFSSNQTGLNFFKKVIPPAIGYLSHKLLSADAHSPAYNSVDRYPNTEVDMRLLIPLAIVSLLAASCLLLMLWRICQPKPARQLTESKVVVV